MLYLVGATPGLDSLKASREFNTARLVRIGHGIYCDPDDAMNMPEFLRVNAVRIANFLYPHSALSHASAFCKGAVQSEDSTPNNPSYKLFLCGPYHKVNQIAPGLTIVQYDTLSNDSVNRFCSELVDGKDEQFGPMRLMCASNELVFLQNFGRRGAHKERALSDRDMLSLRESLEASYGKALSDRLSFIVHHCHDFGRELQAAAVHLAEPIDDQRRRVTLSAGTNNLMEFTLGWGGREVAKLGHNGVAWAFNYVEGWGLPLQTDQASAARSPAFINNLLPEGALLDLLRERMSNKGAAGTVLEQSQRFMSNIAMVQKQDMLKKLPSDAIEASLSEFSDRHGVFQGRVLDLPAVGPGFLNEAADLLCHIDMTRIAGMQPKMAVHLSYDGDLVPAVGLPATHILKLPGVERDSRNIKGVVEWASMSLAEGSGLSCSKFALVELQGAPNVLGFISERFDIPQTEDDMRMLFAEDLCSMMGLPPSAKGMSVLNDVIAKLKMQSTDWEADGEEFFRLNVVNYLLENADFHLKNASLLKVARPMLDGMKSVRLAPAYDIMRTAYFLNIPIPGGDREPMQLGFKDNSGRVTDNHIDGAKFEELAALCGVEAGRAQEIMFASAKGISDRARSMASDLPPILLEDRFTVQREIVIDVLKKAVRCCHDLYTQLPITLNSAEIPESTRTTRHRAASAA